ncbi:MAG: transcription termination factor Rho [Verrucomicrobia bacterium]|nr:transcription termination factor Rho [Verrucomicrobiota bacterium]MBV8481595.1 transcription termination factor Rho [Verrucomicrobiota bacterium]
MDTQTTELVQLPGSQYLIENGTVLELDQLHRLPHTELVTLAREFNLRVSQERTRHQFTFDLLKAYGARGIKLRAEGMLELSNEAYGFLRWERYNFTPCPEDVYVPASILKRFGLRAGLKIKATIRVPRDKEKFMALEEVLNVEGIPIEQWTEPKQFDQLTALFPDRRILLENSQTKSVSARAVDLITPLGRGQRGLIVAPPRAGKTILLKDIAMAIRANSPEVHLILLLVDERPEEVTDLRRSLDCEIFSSTFDETPTRHVQVAELVSERAKRLVELRKDVVILLDSITRLARGYNALQPGRGRIMSGGVESKALLKPKRFFGSARNCEEGGSLTILATALIETESRMDEVIFEEFKGTGNMELHLDRALLEKRIYPSIHILKSGTRRDDLLYHPDEFARITILRKKLAQLPAIEAMEVLLNTIKATKTNAELLLSALR